MRNVKYALNDNQNALLEIDASATKREEHSQEWRCYSELLSVTASIRWQDAALLTFDGDRYGIAPAKA